MKLTDTLDSLSYQDLNTPTFMNGNLWSLVKGKPVCGVTQTEWCPLNKTLYETNPMQISPNKKNIFLSLPKLFAVAVVMVSGCNNTQSPNTESPTATNIQNIIAEHIEAVGGAPAIKQIKTIRKFSSVMTTAPTGNATGTTEEMFDLIADSGWVGLDLGLYQESKGWIGQEGWKNNSLERVRDLTAEELPLDKIGMPVSIIFTLKDTFGSAAFLPPTKYKFNDQDCVKVEIVESPLALYVNEKTKLIEGMEVPNLMRITLSNYKEVNGVQVPYHTKVEIFVVNTTVTSDLKKVEFNGKLDADKFSKPDN